MIISPLPKLVGDDNESFSTVSLFERWIAQKTTAVRAWKVSCLRGMAEHPAFFTSSSFVSVSWGGEHDKAAIIKFPTREHSDADTMKPRFK